MSDRSLPLWSNPSRRTGRKVLRHPAVIRPLLGSQAAVAREWPKRTAASTRPATPPPVLADAPAPSKTSRVARDIDETGARSQNSQRSQITPSLILRGDGKPKLAHIDSVERHTLGTTLERAERRHGVTIALGGIGDGGETSFDIR